MSGRHIFKIAVFNLDHKAKIFNALHRKITQNSRSAWNRKQTFDNKHFEILPILG